MGTTKSCRSARITRTASGETELSVKAGAPFVFLEVLAIPVYASANFTHTIQF